MALAKQRSIIDAISKIMIKILYEFKRKEKTAAIFFDIKKTYDKINRNKTRCILSIFDYRKSGLKIPNIILGRESEF